MIGTRKNHKLRIESVSLHGHQVVFTYVNPMTLTAGVSDLYGDYEEFPKFSGNFHCSF